MDRVVGDAIELLPLEVIDARLQRYRLQIVAAERLMARSLEHYGQLSPIVVCRQEESHVLIDGFKRLRAARKLIGRWQSGQPLRGIARDLGVNRKRVQRVVREHQQSRDQGPSHVDLPTPSTPRGSILDAYDEVIQQRLERYPNITVVRLLEELRQQGYSGGYTVLRQRVKQLRQQPAKKLVVRFETSPGVHYGKQGAMFSISASTGPPCPEPAECFT
jgi:hypothetical protein